MIEKYEFVRLLVKMYSLQSSKGKKKTAKGKSRSVVNKKASMKIKKKHYYNRKYPGKFNTEYKVSIISFILSSKIKWPFLHWIINGIYWMTGYTPMLMATTKSIIIIIHNFFFFLRRCNVCVHRGDGGYFF